MASSLVSTRSSESIEELDEFNGDLGWPVEYRQLEPGSFSSAFTVLEDEAWFVLEERSSRHIEIAAGSPDDMVTLVLAQGDPAIVDGRELGSDQVLLQTPGSGIQSTVPANVPLTEIGMATDRFEEAVDAIAPDLAVPYRGASIFSTPANGLTRVRRAMRSLLRAPASRHATRDEIASTILADIISAAADRNTSISCCLHRSAAQQTLERAREYIEAHLDKSLRVETLCRFAGANLRSLERLFKRELGLSPQQYMKARRLNAARRQLLSGDAYSVAEVARKHGFAHMGRFSSDYHRHFGEYPRATLKISHSLPSRLIT